MANPSITLPDWMREEIDERKHDGVSMSYFIRASVQARFNAEDAGEWEDPDIEPPEAAVTDGGRDE